MRISTMSLLLLSFSFSACSAGVDDNPSSHGGTGSTGNAQNTNGSGGDNTQGAGASNSQSGGSSSGGPTTGSGGDTTGGGANTGSGGEAMGTGGDTSATGGTGSGGSGSGGEGMSASCTPNPAGSITDVGDGTLLDSRTCFMWTKDTIPNTGDWIGKDHVAECANVSIAGHGDWRAPDAAEMLTVVAIKDRCGMWTDNPDIWDPILQTGTLTSAPIFWTSTVGDAGEHQCAVNGNNSNLEGTTRKNSYHVRCVRGANPQITGTIAECTGNVCR